MCSIRSKFNLFGKILDACVGGMNKQCPENYLPLLLKDKRVTYDF